MERKENQDVCQQAISLARQGEFLNWELAELLMVIKSKEEWRTCGARSFKQFLQDHVRIKDSTARQIMKVRSMCDEHGIPRDRANELGWSKLAEIAGAITEESKENLLSDVQQLSQTELRKKYREKNGEAKPEAKPSRQSIEWTEEIEEALRHAARFTRSNELQANLEFIAKSFTTMMPTAPDRDIRFSLN